MLGNHSLHGIHQQLVGKGGGVGWHAPSEEEIAWDVARIVVHSGGETNTTKSRQHAKTNVVEFEIEAIPPKLEHTLV